MPVKRPQATAVREIAEFSTRLDVPVITGSGIVNIRHVVKALSMGVWATMVSGLPTGAEESSREFCYSDGKKATHTVRQAGLKLWNRGELVLRRACRRPMERFVLRMRGTGTKRATSTRRWARQFGRCKVLRWDEYCPNRPSHAERMITQVPFSAAAESMLEISKPFWPHRAPIKSV
jgi:hypothetical protein